MKDCLGDKRGGRFHRGDAPGALMKDFRDVARAVPWWLGLLQERREAGTAHTDNNTESQTTLAVNCWPGRSDGLLAAATHLLQDRRQWAQNNVHP